MKHPSWKRFFFLFSLPLLLLAVAFPYGCNRDRSFPDGRGTKKLKVLDDIADKRVGVYLGTVHDAFVANTYPRATIFRYSSTADILLSIRNDKIDVALLDAISARVLLKKNTDLGILTEDALTQPLGVGFHKGNPQLRDQFNRFLAGLRSDGTYTRMVQRWCTGDAEQAVMPEIELPEQGEPIRLAVAIADLPYVAVINNRYAGLDIELAQRFAAATGRPLRIATMEFSALIAALASGKADMIADGISITEERSRQIDFSDSYLEFRTAVVARKENLAVAVDTTATGFASSDGKTPEDRKGFLASLADSFYSNIILEDRYLLILDGLKTTLILSFLSAVLGTLLGAMICSMRLAENGMIRSAAKVYISLLQGTPVLVFLMILFYVVFAGIDWDPIWVAVLAFGMNFAAYVSEMFRTGIESIDRGQREAAIATGFTRTETFLYIILPQAIRLILPVYKGELISLIKMTSIVGYIAVQDLTKASDIIRSRTFDAFFPLIMVAVLYFALAGLFVLGLNYIDRKTSPQRLR